MTKHGLARCIGAALVAMACGSFGPADAQWPGAKRDDGTGASAPGWPGSSGSGSGSGSPAIRHEPRGEREHFFCTFSPQHRAVDSAFNSFGAGVPPCPPGASQSGSGRSSYFSSYFADDRRAALLKLIRSTGVREDRILVMEKPGFRNAAAAQCAMPDGEIKQLIMWDPQFMGELDRRAGTQWASVAVLAHEIAHHANNDTGQGRLPAHKRREQELYADRWAGQKLRGFGASRDEAVAVFRHMGEGGETHPPSRLRVTAAGEGWDRAEGVEIGTGGRTGPSTPSPYPVPQPGPQPRLVQFCLDGFGFPRCPTTPAPPGAVCMCPGIGVGITSYPQPVR